MEIAIVTGENVNGNAGHLEAVCVCVCDGWQTFNFFFNLNN